MGSKTGKSEHHTNAGNGQSEIIGKSKAHTEKTGVWDTQNRFSNLHLGQPRAATRRPWTLTWILVCGWACRWWQAILVRRESSRRVRCRAISSGPGDVR